LGRLSGGCGSYVGWDHVGFVDVFRPTTAGKLAGPRLNSWTRRATPRSPGERILRERVPDHSRSEDLNRHDLKSPFRRRSRLCAVDPQR
jgi:hypothetical protein